MQKRPYSFPISDGIILFYGHLCIADGLRKFIVLKRDGIQFNTVHLAN